MAKTKEVTVYWNHPETDEEFEVDFSVFPGTPDRGPDFNCAGGYPGDPAEVDFLEIRGEDGLPNQQAENDLFERFPKELAKLEDAALDALDDDYGDY